MPTKIYRGPVTETTPITVEAKLAAAVGTVKPGTLLVLDPATREFVKAVAADTNGKTLYILGEQLAGSINDDIVAADGDSVRAFEVHPNRLYAIRAAAGITLANDGAVSIDGGQAVVADTDPDAAGPSTRMFYDLAPSAMSALVGTTTTAGQLVPVKFI